MDCEEPIDALDRVEGEKSVSDLDGVEPGGGESVGVLLCGDPDGVLSGGVPGGVLDVGESGGVLSSGNPGGVLHFV